MSLGRNKSLRNGGLTGSWRCFDRSTVALVSFSEYLNRQFKARTVFPADLFTFLIRAARAADAHFINPQISACHLHCDFGLKSKPVLLAGDGLNDFAAKYLVAGFHVRQVNVVKQLEISVSSRLPTECQKYRTRCGAPPMKREP